MNNTIFNLFNDTSNVPQEEMDNLYNKLELGISFLAFSRECDRVASDYNVDSDYLSAVIMDKYENNHPEIWK